MTLSYQMPLGNVQSHDASGRFAQTVRVSVYRGRGLAKSSYNFYSGWKSWLNM